MLDRMAYLHVPKSAGTSLRTALNAYFPPDTHVPWTIDPLLYGTHPLPAGPVERLFHDDVPDLSSYPFMVGHLSLPTIERGFDASIVATILREPRSRLLSQYTFWRTYSAQELDYWLPYTGPRYSRLPVGEFLAHPAVHHFIDNLTTRMIVGRHPLIPLDGPIASGDVRAVAESGCAQLDRMGFVDILERGPVVYAAFEEWAGMQLRQERLNETDADRGVPLDVDDLVSSSTLQLLEDRNRADRVLWMHAAQRVGLTEWDAERLANATFGSVLSRVALRHHDRWRAIDTAAGVA